MDGDATWLHCDADSAALLGPLVASRNHERLVAAHLSADRKLLATRTYASSCRASVAVPLRALIGDALGKGGAAMVIAHNHPSGDMSPSDADIETTRRIATMLGQLDIRLLDHLIFASGGDWVSFRRLGWL